MVTNLAGVPTVAKSDSAWSLVFNGFDQAGEEIREALCTLGNGYFATRAAASSAVADGVHYPGTYLAGGYNRLQTNVAGRVVENEDLVNFPNWLLLKFQIADGDGADDGWFDVRTVTILSYRQELDLQHGILLRTRRVSRTGKDGERCCGSSVSFSMAAMHSGCAGAVADGRELVWVRHDPFGDRRTRRQRRCKAVS